MTEHEDRRAAALAVRAGTGFGAAVVGVVGGPVGVLAGAVGKEVLDALGDRFFDTINRHRRERVSRLLEISARVSGVGLDRFSETIESSPALLALLAATVQAAMESPLEEKIYALGGCLGRGVDDEARVDAEMLRVRGLARIEQPEVKLMMLLSEPPEWLPENPLDPKALPARRAGWRREDILRRLPGFVGVLDASLARLIAEGLAFNAGLGTWANVAGQEQWKLSDFGLDCLHLLDASRRLRTSPQP